MKVDAETKVRWKDARLVGLRGAFFAVFAVVCGGCETYLECAPGEQNPHWELPERLSESGLYSGMESRYIGDGVWEYTPAFELWTDGAEKTRWIQLPEGTQIDSRDADEWQFPIGTRLWKEFAYGGAPVETRMLVKLGPGPSDWAGVAYIWDGDDAIASPRGGIDVGGTEHNVPTAEECMGCHGGRHSRVLGFSAVSLGGIDGRGSGLERLVAEGWLSDPLPESRGVPGTPLEQAAVGYLHANCAHCHNQNRPAETDCFDPNNHLDFSLPVMRAEGVRELPVYRSAIGSFVVPGRPEQSELIDLVSSRGALNQMPPVGTEVVHDAGVNLLREWIGQMR